jgi:integrase
MENETKETPKILLNAELMAAINKYLNSQGYAIWTIDKYRSGIKHLFDKFNYLDKQRCKYILNRPNPNQKALLNLIIKAAAEHDIDIPTMNVSKTKTKPREPPRIVYSIDDVKNMIQHLKEDRAKLMFKCLFSIGAGIRISELIKMTWSSFNWKVWIKNPDEYGNFTIRKTKRTHTFSVPVPPELMQSLYAYGVAVKCPTEMFFLGEGIGFKRVPKSDDFVFKFDINEPDYFYKKNEPDKWNKIYVQKVYNHIYYNILTKNLKDFLGHNLRLHALRHARATQLINEGVDISIVSKLLGHRSITTTMIYLDMTSKQQANAIKGIEIV